MADLFFANEMPFFLTLSRKMCFMTINHLADRKVATIFAAFKETCQHCLHQGFCITTLHVDGKFEPLKPVTQALPGRPMANTASANEHIPEIERRVRVVKERSRATRHGLPFSRMPKLVTVFVAFAAAKMLNLFPPKGGVSDILSPRTIMSGETLDCKKHLALRIGQHCQVHQEDTPRNSQLPRSKGAMALGPGGNL